MRAAKLSRQQPNKGPKMPTTDDAMTRERAIAELKALLGSDDVERAHSEADGILCELLTALGFSDVVAAWNDVEKWYA